MLAREIEEWGVGGGLGELDAPTRNLRLQGKRSIFHLYHNRRSGETEDGIWDDIGSTLS